MSEDNKHPFQDGEVEIYYSDIETNKEYNFRILDYSKPPEIKKLRDFNNAKYILYNTISLNNYDELSLTKNDKFIFYVPFKSWYRKQKNLLMSIKWRKYIFTEFTYCELSFIRKGNYLTITSFNVLEP